MQAYLNAVHKHAQWSRVKQGKQNRGKGNRGNSIKTNKNIEFVLIILTIILNIKSLNILTEK